MGIDGGINRVVLQAYFGPNSLGPVNRHHGNGVKVLRNEAMGKNIFHVGSNGMGCYVKLVGNAMMGCNMAVFAEAMCLGAKAGVPTDIMVEVLKNTGGVSKVMELRNPNVLSGDYSAQFMLKLLFKDLGLALDAATTENVPLPIIGLVRQIYSQALVDGRGDDDFSAVAATAESHYPNCTRCIDTSYCTRCIDT